MDIQFYVYGTPKGFDLYGGSPDKVSYFQNSYYDGSKKNSKLTVHRLPHGQIIYSYLRYNLIDSDGRPGAFLGISAVFNGKYCADVTSFYELFDGIYKNILQQGILLKSANGQTMFRVPAFKDAASEIKRFIGMLHRNLLNVFVNDYGDLDNTFKLNVNEGKVCKLNPQEGNDIILQVSKEFPMFSLSHEYATRVVSTAITSEQLQELRKLFIDIKQKVTALQLELPKIQYHITALNALQGQGRNKKEQEIVRLYNSLNEDIRNLSKKCNDTQSKIQQHLHNQPEHVSLISLLHQINEQKTVLLTQQEALSIFEDLVRTFDLADKNPNQGNVGTINTETENTGIGGNNPTPWWKKIKLKHVAGIITIFILVGLMWFLYPKEKPKPDPKPTPPVVTIDSKVQELLNEGDDLINLNPPQFNEALTKYQEANILKSKVADDKIVQLNNKAINYYKQLAKTEFDSFNPKGTKRKIDHYNLAIEELKRAKQFGYVNADTDIEGYKKQTIAYYEQEMRKNNNKKETYADIILSLNPRHAAALAVKNPPKPPDGAVAGGNTGTSPSKETRSVAITIYSDQDKSKSDPKSDNITANKGAKFDIFMGEGFLNTDSWFVSDFTIIKIDKPRQENAKMTILKEGSCVLQIKDANGNVVGERKLHITTL
ncbi:MAG: hypothetical protein FWC41_03385 [Firmicutes bacterium]|nr:hypothetical protein [Bacillota bacterium]